MDVRSPAEIDSSKPSIPAEDVRDALRGILRSEAFSSSKRCCDFLSYVVEQSLAGSQHGLKERTIAVAVFGRTPSYDSHEDAIVRIKATEVRKRLGHYYASLGRESPVRIALPRGGYVPVFTVIDSSAARSLPDRPPVGPDAGRSETGDAERKDPKGDDLRKSVADFAEADLSASVEDRAASLAPAVPGWKWKRVFAFACGVVVLTAAAWTRVHPQPKPTFLEQFWAPALDSTAPVYLVAAAAPVFVAYAPGENLPATTSTEYVATNDQFVGQGDMMASHLIAAMLQRMHQQYKVKTSNTVDVRDLPARTVVLIGYSSTQWESISKELRFYIDGERAGMITDRGQDTEWYPRNLTKDLHTDEDYAIVSRFLDPGTRAMVVLVSGATQYGTEGAAMLVTDADMLRNALHDRPPGWESKNLQIVLRMKVIANSPATPEVVATYYW